MSELFAHHASSSPSGLSHRDERVSPNKQALSWFVIGVLALTPLPLGSVYAFTTASFAVIIGLVALSYAGLLFRMKESWLAFPSLVATEAVLYFVFLFYLVVQIIPFGQLFGPWTVAIVDSVTVTSATISVTPGATINMILRQLCYALFVFLVAQVVNRDSGRRLILNGLLLIVIAYALFALVSLQMGDTLLGIAKSSYVGSATGPFVNRNAFAMYCGLGCVIAAAQIGRLVALRFERDSSGGRTRGTTTSILLYLVAFALLSGVVIATQSRMGLFSTILGVATVVTVVISRGAIPLRAIVKLVIGIVTCLIAGAFFFGEALFERVVDVESSAFARGALYVQVLELLQLRPWLGFGGGAFEPAFQLVHRPPVSIDFTWSNAHSTYLSLWTELGIIAGSLPILAVASVGLRLVLNLARRPRRWISQTVALGAIVLVAAHSTIDLNIEVPANAFVFITLITCGVVASIPTQAGPTFPRLAQSKRWGITLPETDTSSLERSDLELMPYASRNRNPDGRN